MSIRIMQKVWETRMKTHTEKLVMLALADNANDEGYCWPSLPTIARKCNVSVVTVCTHLKRLESAGMITRKPGGGRKSTVYCLHFTTPEAQQPGHEETAEPLSGVHGCPKAVFTRTVMEPSLTKEPKETPSKAGVLSSDSNQPKKKEYNATWKPDERPKQEKLASIQPPADYPDETEFNDFLESDAPYVSDYRGDLYETLCNAKWHHWDERNRRWQRIRDWQAYVMALDNKIEEQLKR